MKKILILFLLSFPIIIFTIVTLTSSVIAYYVPLAVEGIELIEGADISDSDIGKNHQLEFKISPVNARNMSFEIKDEEDNLIAEYNQLSGEIYYYNNPSHIIELSHSGLFIKDGLVKLNVKTNNIGFTQLTIITKDGNYRVKSDIYVLDNSYPADEVQGIVLDYNKTNESLLFGNKNEIKVGFTYFPKQAINVNDELIKEQINEQLKVNASNLIFTSEKGNVSNLIITDYGRGELTIRPNSQNNEDYMTLENTLNGKKTKYTFNLNNGYNITVTEQLFNYSDIGANLYLLKHLNLNKPIVFKNGTNLYGNYFKIDHSSMPEYNEKDANGKLLNVGLKAIRFIGDGSGLHQVHIIGALDENLQPYENIINVQMDANSSNDKLMFVNDVIIENGRYNLSVRGKIANIEESKNDEQTVFNLDNIKLVGAFLASLEIDNHSLEETYSWATIANISRLHISYTAIGVLVQNNRNNNPGSIVNLIEKDNIQAITSTSWRNLDDATGALSANNFGYIMAELKGESYSDVYYKNGKDFYVNPVIMLRGGGRNRSIINFDNDRTIDSLIVKERKPKGLIEVGVVGGTHPFKIYLLDKKLHPDYERN
ncbi:MAG: hypothetical protein WC008_05240 [Bacilli bacterium]